MITKLWEKLGEFQWEKVVEFQLKYRLAIVILMVFCTVLSFYSMFSKLQIKTDFFELYPPKHQYIQLYKEFRKMFGSANVLTIVVERTDGKDIYQPDTIKKIDELTLGVLKIKGCSSLQVSSIAHPRVKQLVLTASGIGMFPLMYPGLPTNEAECERLRNAVYVNKGVRGFYVSNDDKSTVVYAGFWEEGVDLLYLFKEINTLTDSLVDENHQCHIAGYPMLYAWISYYRTQIYMILAATCTAMILLLAVYFRSAGGILLPSMSGLLSAVWGLGFAAALGINLDPLLLVVPVLLSARALSHSCQCLDRFRQEFLAFGDRDKAIVAAYSSLYPPAFLAIVTDGLGILTIAIATIPLMQKLAFFSSFWIITIMVSVMILNPIVISYFYSLVPDKNKLKHKKIEDFNKIGVYTLFMKIIYSLSGPRLRWLSVLVAFLIITVGGYITTNYLKIGDSSAGGAILYPDHPYNIAMEKVNNNFAGASRLIVVLQGKEKEAIKYRKTLETMEELGLFMTYNVQNVGGTLSLADLVRQAYRMYHEGYPKWDMVPESRRDLGQIFWMLASKMAPGEIDQYVSVPDYTNSNVTAFLRDYNHKSIKEAIEKLKEFQETVSNDPDSKVKIRLAGGILGILAAVNEEVEWSYWAILVVIFSTTFVLCTFTYRSFKSGFILLVPLAVSQISCELIMLCLDIDLNIDSLPVTAIGVGIGIDYGIYLMSRLKEECELHNNFEKSRLTALFTTGKVIMFTALTLSVGVGFWLFSTIKFPAEMGLLILVLMVFNMIFALILIPALSGIIKPAFVKNTEQQAW